jgi:hypothetical protein
MSYQVYYCKEPSQTDLSGLMPESFKTEESALEYAFKILERQRKHVKIHSSHIVLEIQGPDGFMMKYKEVQKKYRDWYWLKTGRLP